MDLVRVLRLKDPDRASLLFAFLVHFDADKGRALVQLLVNSMVGFTLVSHRGLERPQQADGPAVLASGQIEALGPQFTREDVDVVGRDTHLFERPDRGDDLGFAVEQTGDPVDQHEQMAACIGIAIGSGHRLPFGGSAGVIPGISRRQADHRGPYIGNSRASTSISFRSPAIFHRSPMAVTCLSRRIVLSIL